MSQYDCCPYKKASEYRKHRPKDNYEKGKGEDNQGEDSQNEINTANILI